jgi:hypothetical protein
MNLKDIGGFLCAFEKESEVEISIAGLIFSGKARIGKQWTKMGSFT